jgi:hypothetical protein
MSRVVTDPPVLKAVRRALAVLLGFGMVGISADLTLLQHYEDANQLIPLWLTGLGLAAVCWSALAPGTAALRVVQLIMLLFVGAGVAGVVLHFQANAEFQREIDPALGGMALFWKVVEAKAPPALAPGVMVQLGLLGLVYTYRHPALRERGLTDSMGTSR